MEQLALFASEMSKDNSELDDTNVNNFPLYFSDDELKEFKKLTKALIKTSEVDNVSDLIFKLVKDASSTPQENNDRCASRVVEGEIHQ